MTERKTDRDHFLQEESQQIRSCVSPRVILLTKNGDFPIVRYSSTKWWGLPGGKATESELRGKDNFLSGGAFPTLLREIHEECGMDISGLLEASACLGLAEIAVVDDQAKTVTLTYTPIFVCPVAKLEPVAGGVRIVNINSHLPGPLFPDARLGITRLKRVLAKEGDPILPVFLNDRGICYVEHRPQIRPLMGRPDWIVS